MSQKQLVRLSGVAAFVLILAAFIVGGETPDANASVTEAVSYYQDHDSDMMIASALLALGAFFYLVFSTTLAGILRRAQGETGGSSALAFAGGVVFAVGATIFAGLGFTAADGVDHLEPAAVQAMNALGSDMFFTVAVGTGAFLIGSGIAAKKTGALPSWLAWAAIVIGVIAITPLGFFGFVLSGLWILIVSIYLAMQPDTA
jgi:hypothetical protein